MGKVSKNARVSGGNRTIQTGSKDYIKVVISEKNPETGNYAYKEMMVHKDKVKDLVKGA